MHYTVSKTVDGRSGSVGPYTTKEAADAAANGERDSAVAAIQAEAQSAVIIAVNFLKNYMAVALQGAVLYLVIGFYPALTASLGSGGDITEQAWAMLGKSVILLVAVFMSGRFTKAITSAI